MKTFKLRRAAFHLHRWIGLVVGLLLILIGITGSLLVFEAEISDWLNTQQFGTIVPQAERLAPATAIEIAKTTHPTWQAVNLYIPADDHHPYKLRMTAPAANPDLYLHGNNEVFVHPYTGKGSHILTRRFIRAVITAVLRDGIEAPTQQQFEIIKKRDLVLQDNADRAGGIAVVANFVGESTQTWSSYDIINRSKNIQTRR